MRLKLNYRKAGLIGLVCLGLIAAVILPGCSGGSAGVEIGDKAPDFQLKGLDGELYSLEDFEGSPIMLNFWATWCGPCRSEMPYLDEISAEWEDDGLVLLAVNVAESVTGVQAYIDSYGFSMQVLLDAARTVSTKFNITAIPTTYFIDKDGIIQNKVLGAFPDKASIETYLNELIYPEDTDQ